MLPFCDACRASRTKASDGKQRVMDIKPESLHQRVPFYVGSEEMVKELLDGLSSSETP
ncbi:MAG: hypothetical protein R2822_17970 [Spirosomataceae bacterium]